MDLWWCLQTLGFIAALRAVPGRSHRVKGWGMDNSLKMLLMDVQAGTFLVGILASLTPDSILENLPHGSKQRVT